MRYLRQYCLGISLIFLLNTSVALAALSINEVAWPNTYFASVLLIACIWVIFIWVRTLEWQSRGLGKMGVATFLLFFPFVSSATVYISEIAWMGSATSANHEWIEIHNSGEAVNVDGWNLSDGMNLNIILSGTIGAENYALLERTSDDSAPGTAFLIYTGALVNTGATLTLRDSGGSVVDQVSGGENWQNIGGDNVTKETAQYTASGWVTDTPTPAAVNGTGRVVPAPSSTTTVPVNNSSGGGSKSSSARKSESVNLRNPETKLALKIEAQSIGYVNQLVPFYVTPDGLDEKAARTILYEWNFGDSYFESGRRVVHRYDYPGEYLVTVFGHKDKNEQTQIHKITILPVGFSLSLNEAGDVQIHNNTAYDVDVSNYVLKGSKEVIFPPRSIILAKATITVTGVRLKTTSQDLVMLYDSDKNLVASTFPKIPGVQALTTAVVTAKPTTDSFISPPALPIANLNSKTDESEVFLNNPVEERVLPEKTPVTVTSPSNNVRWPYLALVVLIFAAYIAVFFGRPGEVVTKIKSE